MSVEIIQGHWVDSLRKLPDKHFQMAATSPPYYGLRSYLPKDHPLKSFELGAEASPDEYVATLVEGFREVRRVLRDDGVLWLNLGDSYARGFGGGSPGEKSATNRGSYEGRRYNHHSETIGSSDGFTGRANRAPIRNVGAKQKDLLGIPWLVAFALRADGWYLRSACPWIKRAAMPESVTDRPGSACEMIFLLSKSDRYYYDHEAVKIPGRCPAGTKGAKGSEERSTTGGVNSRPPEYKIYDGKRNRRNTDWFWDTWQGMLPDANGDPLAFVVNPKPYLKAHFATFAPKLVEPMILSSTSEKGCCMICEAPWERVVERTGHINKREAAHVPGCGDTKTDSTGWAPLTYATGAWRPACACNCEYTIPCRVLDPFGGVATTGMVCEQLGRDCTCLELNPEYIPLAQERIATMK